MKKTVYAFAALASVLSLGACTNTAKTGDTAAADESGLYTGVLPAADAAGIRYSLKLEYGETSDSTAAGKFDLEQVYLVSDTTATDSVKDGSSFKAKGDFSVMEQGGRKYIKLDQTAEEAAKDSVEMPMYFLVDSDSTITMVNSQLEVSPNTDLNYTLTRKK